MECFTQTEAPPAPAEGDGSDLLYRIATFAIGAMLLASMIQ